MISQGFDDYNDRGGDGARGIKTLITLYSKVPAPGCLLVLLCR